MGQFLSQLCIQKEPCINNDNNNLLIVCCSTNTSTDWVDGEFPLCKCLPCRKDKSEIL